VDSQDAEQALAGQLVGREAARELNQALRKLIGAACPSSRVRDLKRDHKLTKLANSLWLG
jgi:hypothetical protein